jgi:hypothetical protein
MSYKKTIKTMISNMVNYGKYFIGIYKKLLSECTAVFCRYVINVLQE